MPCSSPPPGTGTTRPASKRRHWHRHRHRQSQNNTRPHPEANLVLGPRDPRPQGRPTPRQEPQQGPGRPGQRRGCQERAGSHPGIHPQTPSPTRPKTRRHQWLVPGLSDDPISEPKIRMGRRGAATPPLRARPPTPHTDRTTPSKSPPRDRGPPIPRRPPNSEPPPPKKKKKKPTLTRHFMPLFPTFFGESRSNSPSHRWLTLPPGPRLREAAGEQGCEKTPILPAAAQMWC
ncbi:PREDICTED: serine/arginine repetitive matrix protein 1-like [Cyprinodon variegatus]|uniref:serine/arginine repetitive matrix protein 1-like n=1 Tax=Cyprinodon variegatus TaxID=28743 RepID=UPI000742CCD9|nr:PREDICTED: serine/arginine repetitive matrix protein 1-like [Cyprinodon variegatus]